MSRDEASLLDIAQVGAPTSEEEQLVAELEHLGISYLSRQTDYQVQRTRPPQNMLADLVQQPNSRVRTALIALLLAHPEYAQAVPSALSRLPLKDRWTLKLLYTAAMLLQVEYSERLRPFLYDRWEWLPDLFSEELQISLEGTPRERLVRLGEQHQSRTGARLNWVGTYENVVLHLMRRWELERAWSR